MDALAKSNRDYCKEQLMKAESALLNLDKNYEATNRSGDVVMLKNKLLGITYNNLGCFFK
jgi:hypothetical protein